jgi:hypothetical protein
MSEETSTFRLYLMRLLYLGNFVFLGLNVWLQWSGFGDNLHTVNV